MSTITAIVLTYNEQDHIEDCLKSLQWVDEILVVDSYSTDSTYRKASPLCTRIIERKFDNFSETRNYAISQAKSDWILIIDADEVVTKELAAEMQMAIVGTPCSAFMLNRINYMYGKLISYTQPDHTIRLFRKNKAVYKNPLHEVLDVDGKVEMLKNSFLHFSLSNISEHVKKMNFYTDISSKTNRQAVVLLFLKPFYRFFHTFTLKGAYRDGTVGFIASVNAFFYEMLNLFKVWEAKLAEEDWASFYEDVDIIDEIKHQENVHKDLIDKIVKLKPSAILEIGSGAAAISFSIAKRYNIKIVTVDNNKEVLKKVKANAKKIGVNIETVHADAHHLPFEDDSFKVVFSQGVLEHFTDYDIKSIINEKIRVSSNSVFFSVPNNFYRKKDFGNERLMSKAEWEKVLSDYNIITSTNYYYIRSKRNFLRRLPVMYMCEVGKYK